jgi:hypothetical protein
VTKFARILCLQQQPYSVVITISESGSAIFTVNSTKILTSEKEFKLDEQQPFSLHSLGQDGQHALRAQAPHDAAAISENGITQSRVGVGIRSSLAELKGDPPNPGDTHIENSLRSETKSLVSQRETLTSEVARRFWRWRE